MPPKEAKVVYEQNLLQAARQKGPLASLKTFCKLSGPGWLQSAITLGGGSLGSSLYLGILGGLSLIWLQPFAMTLGIIMLSAISYVSLSTGKRPFRAINEHINPVLGWSWLAATLLANMVWSLPQYSLCFAVFEQNLFPGLFQGEGLLASGPEGGSLGKWMISFAILALCTIVTWSYGSGSKGIKVYELLLKLVVALIVVCFVGVVFRMSLEKPGIKWAVVFSSLIPNPRQLFEPAETFRPLLEAILNPAARQYWSDLIVSEQRDVMLSAGAAAVGINMTFLLPYSLLSRGWDKTFRGLTIFDLSIGMFIPFVLATGCVVIASAQQFHTKLPDGFTINDNRMEVPDRFSRSFQAQIDARNKVAVAEEKKYTLPETLTTAEQQVAAVLVRRDTYDLAESLEQLFTGKSGQGGRFFSNIVFGVGVVGMTLSSISLMMLISGFVVCEVLNRPPTGWTFRLGCMASAIGVLWPLIWDGGARAWLTIVAGVFGAMLLPIAYLTFFVMMNNCALMGEDRPAGIKRIAWNVLMAIAALAATAAGISAILKKTGWIGLAFVAAYLILVLTVQIMRRQRM